MPSPPNSMLFRPAGQADVVVDAAGEGHQATGVQAQGLVVQLLADHRAAGMHEGQTVAFQLLQDEPLAGPKKPAPRRLLKLMPISVPYQRREKASFFW